MHRKFVLFAAALSVVGLSACDHHSNLENAIMGAAIGCAAGEVIKDGKCVQGAVVGGAAGAMSNSF